MNINSRSFLILEYVFWFIALPATLAICKPHAWIYFVLWLLAALSCMRLEKYYNWNFYTDWNFAGLNRAAVKDILMRFIPFALALFFFTWSQIPDHLFSLPRERPGMWVMVLLLYPPLSAMPQEILFRTFIFKRFGPALSHKALILTSAFAFSFAHVVLRNWVAVIFSFLGGFIFADTYSKTRSLAAVYFEHALYGCYLFTIGLGYYFYHGTAVK
jgi:membrane protease YdiL (CAAX protease family)